MNRATEQIDIVGIYHVPEHKGVSMVEVIVHAPYTDFDPDGFMKPVPQTDPDTWERADDVRYLNPEGSLMIGDRFQRPIRTYPETRMVVFFHDLDITMPLVTPYGLLPLPKRRPMPERLRRIIQYHPVD
jgi:hypothetical protein